MFSYLSLQPLHSRHIFLMAESEGFQVMRHQLTFLLLLILSAIVFVIRHGVDRQRVYQVPFFLFSLSIIAMVS